jgi:hypothetical protein
MDLQSHEASLLRKTTMDQQMKRIGCSETSQRLKGCHNTIIIHTALEYSVYHPCYSWKGAQFLGGQFLGDTAQAADPPKLKRKMRKETGKGLILTRRKFAQIVTWGQQYVSNYPVAEHGCMYIHIAKTNWLLYSIYYVYIRLQ